MQEDGFGSIPGALEYFFKGENLGRVLVRRIFLERKAIEGNSPVFENHFVLLAVLLKYLEDKITLRESSRTNRLRLNTLISPIANKYREGKVKSREEIPVK